MPESFVHPANTAAPMDVNLLPSAKVAAARLVQPSNAAEPIFVTEAGMRMSARLEQSRNASHSIVVNLLPSAKSTVWRAVQPLNACCLMVSTEAGMAMCERLEQSRKS